MKLLEKILIIFCVLLFSLTMCGSEYILNDNMAEANNIPEYTIYGVTVHDKEIDFSEIKLIDQKGKYLIPIDLLAQETGFKVNWNKETNELYLSKSKEKNDNSDDNTYEVIKFCPTTYDNIDTNNNFCMVGLNINGTNREMAEVPMSMSPIIIDNIIYVPLEETAYLMGYNLQWNDTYVNLIDEYLIKIQYYVTNEKIKEVYSDVYDKFFFDFRYFDNLSVSQKNKAFGISEAKFTYDVFTKSNLTVEQLNTILKDTGLHGQGNIFYDMEQQYNINALFCISVGCLESGNFTSSAFVNKNNPFGIGPGKSFSSVSSAVNYFASLMNKCTYKNKSINEIGSIYCVGGDWANQVKEIMRRNWNKL